MKNLSEIETHLDYKIKILITDYVREYLFFQFQSFLNLQGILHQISCAHTPQQSGVAECKNHHLVETTHTPSYFLSYLLWTLYLFLSLQVKP